MISDFKYYIPSSVSSSDVLSRSNVVLDATCGGNKIYWMIHGYDVSFSPTPCICTSRTIFIIPAAEYVKLKPSAKRIL